MEESRARKKQEEEKERKGGGKCTKTGQKEIQYKGGGQSGGLI